jgi:hypothetical protein
MDRDKPVTIDDDELAVGIDEIVDKVFDGKLNSRQGYREITKPDYGAFKILNKHAVYVNTARAALRRRGQRQAAGE